MKKVTMEWLYSFLALLLYLSFVHPCSGETGREKVVVFEDTKTEVLDKGDDKTLTKLEQLSFGVPAFVGGMFKSKEFFAVLCDARYIVSPDAVFIKPAVKTSYADYRQWNDANVIVTSTHGDKELKSIGKVTAVIKEEKIYVLATGFETSDTLEFKTDGTNVWDSLMIVGTVKHSAELAGGDGGVTITWDNAISLKSLLKTAGDAQNEIYFVGGMGNGVIMKKGTIVLPIGIKHKSSKHDAATIIYSDDGETWHMGKRTVFGTSQGSVVEFGEGKLLLSVQFTGGVRAVYESNNMGDTWKYSQTFAAVWGNQPNRNAAGSQGSVITAPVDQKDVLLFAHPLNTAENGIRDTLQLWVSDGQRIACVGTISETEKGKHTGNSILAYINNKLYITHEITSYENQVSGQMTKPSKVIATNPLDDYFERVKKTVLEWRAVDTKIVESGNISVDGLVGYWGNTTEGDKAWTDMYNCVNAIVTGATRVQGGFRFSVKADSGVQWPVGSQGQNQLYRFTQRQFTFSVTVQSNYTRETEDVMLLGARNSTQENNILFGIGYTKDMKWYTLDDKGTKHITNTSFEQNKKYHIALTFVNGLVSFYVDLLCIKSEILITSPKNVIKEFFMGSIGTPLPAEDRFCTVKNVMLFNRYLQLSDIARLYRVSKNGNLDEPLKIAEPAPPPATRQSVQTTAAATAPKKDHSVQTKKTTTLPVSEKAQSTTTPKQTSVTDKQTNHNAKEKDKYLDHVSREKVDATLKKKINHTDGSEISFGFLQLTCVVCSIILLVQF